MPLTLQIAPVYINRGAGNLARSRLLAGSLGLFARQVPAESRLQPGLAAPLFVQK
jgi:hypothetical protein